MKKLWLAIGIITLVFVGWITIRTYPRHISLSLKGVQYKLGSPRQGVTPVTLQLNGTLHPSIFGSRSFVGAVNVLGSNLLDKIHGKTLDIVFNQNLGGQIVHFNPNEQQFYVYGELYPNTKFTTFTIAVFQREKGGSGWSGASGLMISAPAQTRSQALQISNELMKALLLPGHPLR